MFKHHMSSFWSKADVGLWGIAKDTGRLWGHSRCMLAFEAPQWLASGLLGWTSRDMVALAVIGCYRKAGDVICLPEATEAPLVMKFLPRFL